MDVITEGKKIQNELVELRRYFHEHPELPWEEFNTQKKIMEYLDELGIPYQESSKTGVIATIKGPHSSDKISRNSCRYRCTSDYRAGSV